jgi:hypothetical protein
MIPFGFFKPMSSSSITYIDVPTGTTTATYGVGTWYFKATAVGGWFQMKLYFLTPAQFFGSVYLDDVLNATYPSGIWSLPTISTTNAEHIIKVVCTAGQFNIQKSQY